MRKLLSLLALTLLAACQTVQPSDGFTEAQKTVLRANGFQPVGSNWEFGMADRLLFSTDQSVLIPAQRDVISRIASALVAVEVRGAKVEGHTDNTGTAAYNEQLSQKRAQAVADALAAGRSVDYQLSGRIGAIPEDGNRRDFEVERRSALSPAPGLPGVMR